MDGGQHVICQTGVSLRSRIPDVMGRREAMAMTPILSSHLIHESRRAASRLFTQPASAEGSLPQLLCALLITRAQLAVSLAKRNKSAATEAPDGNGKSQLLVKLRKVGSSYSGILCVTRSNDINGHHWPVQRLSGHPLLPLLITSSAFRAAEGSSAELLLWLSDSASPLSSDCRQSATDTCLSGSPLDFRPANSQGLR
ncbi:unnamed protein product, partial [Dibothriocephalus latus]